MEMIKKKAPEAVVTEDGFYVRLDAVRRLIGDISKKFLKHRAEDFKKYMQEMLDNGADIDVRRSRKAFKAEEREFKRLLDIIDETLESSEQATVREDNKIK